MDKKRTFFFFGVQATRLRTNGVGGTSFLPTPTQLGGTFTGLSSPILNPTTLAPYPCKPTGRTLTCKVSPNDYNKSSLALLKYLPTITGNDGTYQFLRPSRQYW
jgi:hypothetical protein